MIVKDYVEQLIQHNRLITWRDFALMFGQDPRTIRKWIYENVPEVKLTDHRKRKRSFSPGESRLIIQRWDEIN